MPLRRYDNPRSFTCLMAEAVRQLLVQLAAKRSMDCKRTVSMTEVVEDAIRKAAQLEGIEEQHD